MDVEAERLTVKVLVINSGSSSIKYQVLDVGGSPVLSSGVLEKIGESGSRLIHSRRGGTGEMEEISRTRAVSGHREGLEWIMAVMAESGVLRDTKELFGIGHRVVHGGEAFKAPTLIDGEVVAAIRKTVPLAPLHNPANLAGIEVALELCPNVPQVAVFDTAFHQSMPPHAFHYALPHDLYTNHRVRRYGFHGTSHGYVARKAAGHLGRPLESLNLITLHLGNGASATAVKAGRSVDTSMGMTPLEGLVMGTRCGDLDPAIHFYLGREAGMTTGEMETMLYRESGMKGICGVNDMREAERLAEEGDGLARLAIDMYCYRIRKYIGAYFAVLGVLDAVVFTGGVGENSQAVRKRSCEGLSGLGIIVDDRKNEAPPGGLMEIQGEGGKVRLLVIPTDEELEIALRTVECIRSG